MSLEALSLYRPAHAACVLPRVTRPTAGVLAALAVAQAAEEDGEVGQDPRDPQAHEMAHLACPVDGPADIIGRRDRRQGHSVFEFNPDKSQRLSWLGRQPAACRRDIRMARPPQQPNRGVAERRHDLGDAATAHL
jgi:hypothetical protein